MRPAGRRYRPRKKPYLYWLIPAALIVVAAAVLFAFRLPPFAPVRPAVHEQTPAAFTPGKTAPVATAPASPQASPANTAPASPSSTPGATPAAPKTGKPAALPQISYSAALQLAPSYDRFYGKMSVDYVNTTGDTLYELVFHLYPNAYAKADGPGAAEAQQSYGKIFSKGQTIISSVSLNGDLAYFTVSDDGMLLTVPFVKELQPGEKAAVFIEFAVDVPTRNGRFGKTQLGYQLGNFLPILAVYQDGSWMSGAYTPIGDPFYSETADYKVAVSYPEGYSIACTGEVASSETKNGIVTSYCAASKVRDFACMLGAGMQKAEIDASGVKIHSYALSGSTSQRGAELAQKALSVFSDKLGGYPYKTLTIAQADMAYAGMEYPGLCMIQRELYLPGRELELEMTIAHEILHQWFYGVVGNDEQNAPWLDEAITSYLSVAYFDLDNRADTYNGLLQKYVVERAALGGRIDGALTDYSTEDAYVNAAYWRGAAMFHALREKFGDATFFASLRDYIKSNAYNVAVKTDLARAFTETSGVDMAAWFDQYLAAPIPAPDVTDKAE